ncbi:MAG: signal transduction histidine kinase [Crocinitomix sp.]|jgi:signal transduction histidine kinase
MFKRTNNTLMHKVLLTIFTVLLVVTAYSAKVIQVTNTSVKIIGKDVLYFEDQTKVISLNQAIQFANSGEFETCSKAVFAKPSSPSIHWFSFSVESLVEDELWINVVNQGFNTINFYLLDEQNNLLDSVSTGAELPAETRQRKSKTFWFNLFQDDEVGVRTVFLQISFSGILEVPILLGGYEELVEVEDENELYGIMFIGALLVMLLYNGFLAFFTKDVVYVFYTGYILFILVITTHVNNYPIMPDIFGSYFTYQYLFVWISPISIFMAMFIIRYLELDKFARKSAIVIRVFAIASLLVGMSNLFIPAAYLTNAYQVSAVLLLIICMVVGFKQWFNGRRRAKFYTVGWTINIISVLVFIAVSNGFLPYNSLSRNSMYFGVFCELVIFSIALAERLNELKNEQMVLNKKLVTVNENLVVSNESLDSFNYHVSHDLKTVLNNSNALTRMIKKYNLKKDHDKVEEIAEKLIGVTENGVETVHSFLSLSTINALNQTNELETVKLEDEIKSIILLNGLEDDIEVDAITSELDNIVIHRKAFQSIFMNLFTNTIKFNMHDPQVKVEFLRAGKFIQVIYTDNGIGIDLKKNKNVVFAPFERINGEVKVEGTGVGLYLVKRMIENYGGSIEIQSELNEGVKFIITIPELGSKGDGY